MVSEQNDLVKDYRNTLITDSPRTVFIFTVNKSPTRCDSMHS